MAITDIKTSVDQAREVAGFLSDVVVRFMDPEAIGAPRHNVREKLLEQVVPLQDSTSTIGR